MFLLAHLSDVHLAPMPQAKPVELFGKRLSGYLSWRLNRHDLHSRAIADLLARDVISAKPDHVAITGDMVNIALEAEFSQALAWLKQFGRDDWITLVPGNHDAYVSMAHSKGIGQWQASMTGNTPNDNTARCFAGDFPFVRRIDDIALIGVSTAVPTLPFVAGGRIGKDQLEALEKTLFECARQNLCRVILIHHPPLPGQNSTRKALWDAVEFKDILQRQGAELVLHGHNHTHMYATTPGPGGQIPVYGVPSASMQGNKAKPRAHYYLFKIARTGYNWSINGSMRRLKTDETGFEPAGPLPQAAKQRKIIED